MSNFDFSNKFITKNNLKEIAEIAIVYALIMFYAFFSATTYGFKITFENSTFLEIVIAGLIFLSFAFFSTLILIYKYYSSCKISVIYGKLTGILIFLIYLLLTFEVFDIYWIELNKNSKLWSSVFSGLFFTPIVILSWEILQIIFQYFYKESSSSHHNLKSKNIGKSKNIFLSSTYNENGLVFKTTYEEQLEDGHIVRVHTFGLDKNPPYTYQIEHIRTEENYNRTKFTARDSDFLFNSERIKILKIKGEP